MTDETILDGLLRAEGGFVNLPADKGGPTNFGVTQETLAAWRGRPVSVEEVRLMSPLEARAIYRDQYLRPFDALPEPLRVQMVDFAVNSGVGTAWRWLQKVVGVLPDGHPGPVTMAALGASGSPRMVNNALVAARLKFIDDLSDAEKSQKQFEEGWENRALTFLVL